MSDDGLIRRARVADLAGVAALAGELVRMHHRADPARFLAPSPRVEEGYQTFLRRELGRRDAFVFVAEQSGEILGYAYATIEGRDWIALLDEHGKLHDVFVAEPARRAGIGSKLVSAVVAALEARGVQRIVLATMVTNEAAQKLFARLGFRPTMLEMTWSAQR